MTVPATTQTAHEDHREAPHAARAVATGPRPVPWAAPAAEPVPRPEPALDPALVEILRCPLTGGGLVPVDADRLMSDRPFRDGVHPVYSVVGGIACLTPPR